MRGLLRARGRVLPTLAVAMVMAAGGPSARADEKIEKARQHYLQGNAYYKVDKFRQAVDEYQQAYVAKPDPSFLFNIAQCHRLMGNRAEALKYYRRYLRDQPVSPNSAVAQKHVRDLEGALDEQLAVPSSLPLSGGAQPSLDPEAAPATEPAAEATAKATTAMTAPPPLDGSSPAPALALAPTAPDGVSASGRDEASPPIYQRWWFWTAAAVVAVVATGVAIGVATSEDQCDPGRTCM